MLSNKYVELTDYTAGIMKKLNDKYIARLTELFTGGFPDEEEWKMAIEAVRSEDLRCYLLIKGLYESQSDVKDSFQQFKEVLLKQNVLLSEYLEMRGLTT